jgi:hypothetical protein
VQGISTKKSITNLIGKLNMMLTKQGFKNAWTYIRYGFLVFYVGSNNNFYYMEYLQMNRETKDGIGFVVAFVLFTSSIILLNYMIN